MGETMQIPPEWLTEAGLQNFVAIQPSFRCTAPHVLIALADIERVVRTVALDANGFCRKRMMRILVGIRDDDAIPPIYVEKADPDQRPYRLREGVHRLYASITLGFSHAPAEIIERLY
jgi:hypothetical protein